MLTHEDKRRHARRTLSVEFRAGGTDGLGALELSGADLSAGGAFLVSDLLLEPGEMLSLEFRIAGRPDPALAQVRVAWVRRFPGPEEPAGMGIEFVRLGKEERAALDAWVRGGE
ncbi:MAG TPA: PilZ domain-containing protein [Myxococcaceae bacterium]|nr:PilZ domain-containing protein [Myxococcaceae bacterium]